MCFEIAVAFPDRPGGGVFPNASHELVAFADLDLQELARRTLAGFFVPGGDTVAPLRGLHYASVTVTQSVFVIREHPNTALRQVPFPTHRTAAGPRQGDVVRPAAVAHNRVEEPFIFPPKPFVLGPQFLLFRRHIRHHLVPQHRRHKRSNLAARHDAFAAAKLLPLSTAVVDAVGRWLLDYGRAMLVMAH